MEWPETTRVAAAPTRIARWLADHTLVAVTFGGSVLYAITRLSYMTFYGTFGVDSEEVGVNYTVALTRSAPGLIALFLEALFVAFCALLLYLWVPIVFNRARQRFRRVAATDAHEPKERSRVELLGVVGTVVVLVFLVSLPDQYRDKADRVRGGEELVPSLGIVDGDLFENPLGIRAEHVRVHWVDESRPADPPVADGTTVTYLGRSGDTVVLYDFRGAKQSLRIPASLVTLVDAG